MSKQLILWITCTLLSSCGIPTVYQVKTDGYSDIECLSTNVEYYITRSVNTYPLFSDKPIPKTELWKIYILDEKGALNLKLNDKYSHKLESKTCEWPTSVREYEIIPIRAKLELQRVVTRSDTWAANRMFLYGVYKSLKGEKIKWTYERKNNKENDIRKRILQEFKICRVN